MRYFVLLLVLMMAGCGHPERVSDLPLSGQHDQDGQVIEVKPGEAPRSNLAADRLDAAAGTH